MLLARSLNAQITAVDFLPDFIEVLKASAENEGLTKKIDPLVCSMDSLQFDNEEFDVIWSEGAIYNMGFENGINDWKRFLKPGGWLVVSEITWTTNLPRGNKAITITYTRTAKSAVPRRSAFCCR